MKTIRTKVYKFKELQPEAQKKAVELLSDINTDYDWWYFTYSDFDSLAKYFGFDVDLKKTWFTLSNGQGDGSSYTADIDVLKMINCIEAEGWKEYAPKEAFNMPAISKNVKRICKLIESTVIDLPARVYPVNRETNINVDISDYSYSNSRRLENVEYAIGELEKIITHVAKELNKFLFRSLQNECDYQSGKEAITETIEANDYDFFQDGKLYDNR